MNMDEESEESEECPICMEEVEHFINLRCCRGKICPRCLNKLVSQRCPLCRGSLDALSLLSPWCRHCLKKRADCTCPPRPPVSPVSPVSPVPVAPSTPALSLASLLAPADPADPAVPASKTGKTSKKRKVSKTATKASKKRKTTKAPKAKKAKKAPSMVDEDASESD